MHNCKTAHPKKSHRRRNCFFRKTLTPLHWWEDERAKTGEWGGVELIVRPEPKETRLIYAPGRGTTGAEVSKPFGGTRDSESRVRIYTTSALRRLAANVRRFMPFTRKSG